MQPGVKSVKVAGGEAAAATATTAATSVVIPTDFATYSRIPAPVAPKAAIRRHKRAAPTAGGVEPSQLAAAPTIDGTTTDESVVEDSGVTASLVEPDVPTTTSGAIEHGGGVTEDTDITLGL